MWREQTATQLCGWVNPRRSHQEGACRERKHTIGPESALSRLSHPLGFSPSFANGDGGGEVCRYVYVCGVCTWVICVCFGMVTPCLMFSFPHFEPNATEISLSHSIVFSETCFTCL